MNETDKADFLNAIEAASREAARIAEEHGFKENSVGEDIALMHSELSEALEDYRAGKPANQMLYETPTGMHVQHSDFQGTIYKPVGLPSELADVVIRIMHFSHRHGIDLGKAIIEKMAFNETRPFKHGNKVI